ncbi:MAG: dual specificity protein phosphatase family protein [Candidatus Latescibacterota bacterium]|nr:dual specificity protein phosphatase family protein [Candidatus Latescibacterota bacterium]
MKLGLKGIFPLVLWNQRQNDELPAASLEYRVLLNGFSWVEEGKIAGMRRPGSLYPLAKDLADLKDAGVDAIVSLTEISLDQSLLVQSGMTYLQVPILDFHPPALCDINQVISFTRSSIAAQRAVVIHCTAGLGRTGTMLACWLVSEGESPGNAIFKVRSLRPGSIETSEQRQIIFDYADTLTGAGP